jgi:hypothetical protein
MLSMGRAGPAHATINPIYLLMIKNYAIAIIEKIWLNTKFC